MRNLPFMILCCFATLCLLQGPTGILAQEDVRKRIEDLQAKAEALAERGQNDRAQELLRVVRELQASLRQKGQDRTDTQSRNAQLRAQLDELRAQAEKLKDEGKEDALRRVLAQIREVSTVLERSQDRRGERREERERPELRRAEQRLEHMQAALGHLKEAGLNELAQAVAERMERLRQELRGGERRGEEIREQPRNEVQGAIREFGQAIRQLREEVQLLRREVNQLKERK